MNRSKMVTTLPAIALLVGCTTVLAANESTPAKLIKAWPIKPFDGTDRSRTESWANLSFVIDTQGDVTDVEVLSHSEVRFDEDDFKRLIKMWQFEPAILNGEPIDASWLYTVQSKKMFDGVDNGTIKRGFLSTGEQIQAALADKNFDLVRTLLNKLDEHTKNNAEQALNHWFKAQYYYFVEDWHQYGHHLQSAYALSKELPTEYRIKLHQNTLHWFMYTREYLSANTAINSFYGLGDVNMDKAIFLKAKKQLAKELNANPELHYSYTLEPNKPKLLGLSRYSVQIKTQEPLTKAQLRCRYGVLDVPKVSENRYAITQTEANVRCGLLIKSETEQSIEIEQTGQAIRL